MKFGLWVSIIANVCLVAICAYGVAVIQHLQFIIKLLAGGSVH